MVKNYSPLLIAEIGGNHQGNFNKAIELTQLALESGAQAVKFQIYYADSLVSEKENELRYKHFKGFELSQEQHLELAKMVKDAGLLYSASIWDESSIDVFSKYLDFIKIGSGDLTAYNILYKLAKLSKPIVLSTGLSSFDEVSSCVQFLRSCNKFYLRKESITLLQCTSMYPINLSDVNLSVLHEYATLNCSIGYSDHTVGLVALKQAISFGVDAIEFHFTDDKKNESFRDHKVSLDINDVLKLKQYIERTNVIMGSGKKHPLEIEISSEHVRTFRRSIYVKRDVPKGTVLTENDLTTLRPNNGICASKYFEIIGKQASKSLSKGDLLTINCFK